MDWSDTPEQAAFRDQVRKHIADRLPAYYRDAAIRLEASIQPEADWQQDMMHGTPEAQAAARDWASALQEYGWVAAGWPKEYGGGGLSTMEQFILKQELSRAEAPDPGSNGGVAQLGSTLLVHGTEEQKKKFLPKTLSGEYLWAQGYSEPGAGSDLASLQTRAVRDGDEFVINGQKLWTSAGHKANWIYMLVRTDPDAPKHRGISFLMVDMTTPGIGVRPIISMGWHHATNETFYEDVRVPVDQVVGEINRGWYVGMTLLDFERSNIAGATQQKRLIDELVDHVQSGNTPNRLELLRREVADRATEVEVNNNLSMRIASMQSRGLIPNYEASMGKAYSTELSQRISRTGTKVFGLYGNLWAANEPYAPLHAKHTQQYVSTVVITIAGGSNEIQRNIIATRGLGLPRG
ncbi:MAG: acyl-CoA dehydrogenase family protein [Dehalococcoidia bacterium]